MQSGNARESIFLRSTFVGLGMRRIPWDVSIASGLNSTQANNANATCRCYFNEVKIS